MFDLFAIDGIHVWVVGPYVPELETFDNTTVFESPNGEKYGVMYQAYESGEDAFAAAVAQAMLSGSSPETLLPLSV
jgi:hypothetical protein